MQQPLVPTSSLPLQTQKLAFLTRSLTLMKPITWFGPMWALLCGAIASGATGWNVADIGRILLGVILAGPILCGISQVINDYFDREVDALNEPNRLIPSGLVGTTQILLTLAVLLAIGVAIGLYLGQTVARLSAIGLVLAVAYSAPPLRAKRNGWIGNSLVAIAYEGLAWMAGHAAFAPLTASSVLIALFYSVGAHGIMSINDFKSMQGDRLSGIRSIPVLYGPQRAAWLIVLTMNLAQLKVIMAFALWGRPVIAAIIAGLVLIQLPFQWSFLQQPVERHLKFSAIGVSFFVWGMMVAAVGLRNLGM
jgi:chlorophyll synthase